MKPGEKIEIQMDDQMNTKTKTVKDERFNEDKNENPKNKGEKSRKNSKNDKKDKKLRADDEL